MYKVSPYTDAERYLYKDLGAVYCPVGGLPSTKNKPGDRPKGGKPTQLRQ